MVLCVRHQRLTKSCANANCRSLSWQPGQLEREIEASIWTKAACSRSVVLKQCWQLPVPLWREVNKLMGVVLDEG